VECRDCDSNEFDLTKHGYYVGNGLCSECHGTGESQSYLDERLEDDFGVDRPECEECSGTGQCQTCGGTGEVDGDDEAEDDDNRDEDDDDEDDGDDDGDEDKAVGGDEDDEEEDEDDGGDEDDEEDEDDRVSIEGPVELVDGELTLRIPLTVGGAQLAAVSNLGRIEGQCWCVTIKGWLAEKLRITEGTLVVVDNHSGKFRITRSAANDTSL
jgi:hypothetical protein